MLYRPLAACSIALTWLTASGLEGCDHESERPHEQAPPKQDAGDDTPGPEMMETSPLDPGRDAGEAEASLAVRVRFQARLGSAVFACGQRYPDVGRGKASAEPRDFRFYVQDVRLIDDQGQERALVLDERTPWQTPDVALLAFADDRAGCMGASSTNAEITGRAPAGVYRGVVFRIGVPEHLNHVNPAMAPAPLQAPGVSWGWMAGFRFLLAELSSTPATNGAPARPGRGLLHLGSMACAGDVATNAVHCGRSNRAEIRLEGYDPRQNVVVADLSVLFAQTDLSRESLCHSGATQADCAALFQPLGLDQETGESLGLQEVFRVE